MTVPQKVRRELWALEWDDAEGPMVPRDQETFLAYGRRVVGFLRSTGLALSEAPETRLVASPPGAGEERMGVRALVNVGESACLIGVRRDHDVVALRLPPDEACVLSRVARTIVVVPPEAEFGLLLELW